MEFKITPFLLLLAAFSSLTAVTQSAPNNSTASLPSAPNSNDQKNVTNPATGNSNASNSSTVDGSSGEDCDAEPEPSANGKNVTHSNPAREGKQLNPGENEEYNKMDKDGIRKTSTNFTPGLSGDAAKLQGNSSTTTTAPSKSSGTSLVSLSYFCINILFTVLLVTFTL